MRLWDLELLQEVACCEGHRDWVWGLSMQRDGGMIASCSRDRTARVWQWPGTLVQSIEHKMEVLGVGLSQDGTRLYSAQGKHVQVWCTASLDGPAPSVTWLPAWCVGIAVL